MNRTFVVLALIAPFGAYRVQIAVAGPVKKLPITEADCKAAGGSMAQVGLPGTGARCDIKTNDAGKTCSDSDKCQGICMASKNAALRAKDTGTCSAYVAEYGCYKYIEDGIVDTICVD